MIARLFLSLVATCFPSLSTQALTTRPNIVWIVVEDMSANFGCYGETFIQTPNVDRLAKNMLAILGDTGVRAAAAEHLVGFR